MAFELFFFKALDLGFVSFEHLRVYGRWTQEAVGAFLFSGGGGGVYCTCTGRGFTIQDQARGLAFGCLLCSSKIFSVGFVCRV